MSKKVRDKRRYLVMMTAIVLLAAVHGGTIVEKRPHHVFSMSCKVTSCNGELATASGREMAIAWFRKNHITKLWLESYRHNQSVTTERLIALRDAFRAEGFELCGMITPTRLNDAPSGGERRMVVCWSDRKARSRMTAECLRTASVFDCIIIDDFLFSNCGDECASCKADKKRRGIADWGEYRRTLMQEICERDILAETKAKYPNAHFIIKFPCWYANYGERGYDPRRQSELFGECWVGTETRDANPDALQACWIVQWMNRQSGGRCGGGWYDGLDTKPAKFLEQAYYTILGGARESLVHCYDYLVAKDPGLTPFGEKATGGHACAAAFTAHIEELQALADELIGAERLGFEMRADGVSVHAFRKNSQTIIVKVNTKSGKLNDVSIERY